MRQPRHRSNADVVIRRTLSQDKPHRERVTCFKVTPALAGPNRPAGTDIHSGRSVSRHLCSSAE
jgi:hypothetical protein